MSQTSNSGTTQIGRRGFLTATACGATLASVGSTALLTAGTANAATTDDPLGIATTDIDIATLPRVKLVLVAPPQIPAHDQIATTGPKIVEVTMTVIEKKITLDDEGTTVWAFAYEGSVPGPMIVAHQGDYIELTLKSAATNELEHNIDFHAATGAMGGGEFTKIMPGEQVQIRFRLLKAGVFTYHCAPGDEMTPYHVTHGMNGTIMVLPRGGLRDKDGNSITYDRAYFIGEQDFYIPRHETGAFKSYETAMEDFGDALEVMRGLIPTHVVFNGAKGALTGANAMTAAVGDTVLFVHNQANRDTRPHLIGAHGEYVWENGSFSDAPATDVQTWFVRGGSAGAMVYTFKQPGTYAYVNHNLIEAVLLGAAAHIKVTGDWDNKLMEQLAKPAAF